MAIDLDMLLNLKDNASGKLGKFENKIKGVQSTLLKFAGGFIAIKSIGDLGSALFDTNAEFEKLQASLKTVTGSSEEAQQAFGFIQGIAQKLPYSIQETTDAFIKMKSLGLTPTREALTSFSNTSAAMGKGLNQMIEAVADAATGEFERLKEFGIKSKSQGDQVQFTFQGVTTTVKKNSTEITKYLQSIGEVQFAGAAAEQMNTLGGLTSNLGDSFARLAKKIGESGLNDLFKKILRYGISAVNSIIDNFDLIEFAWIALKVSLINSWIEFKRDVGIITVSVANAFDQAVNGMMNLWNGFIGSVQEQANKMAKLVGMEPFFKEVRKATAVTMSHAEAIKQVNDAADQERKANIAAGEAAADEAIQRKLQTKNQKDYNDTLKEGAAASEKQRKADQALADQQKKDMAVWTKLKKEIDDHRDAVDSALYAQDLLDQAFIQGKISAEEYGKAMDETNKIIFDDFGKTEKKAKESTDAMGEHLKTAAQSMQTSLSDFIKQAIGGNASFKDLEAAFKNTIDQMVADLLASKLFELLLGNFGTTGKVGGAVGGLATLLGFRAGGGDVNSGKPYVVGEKGPELIVPKVDGTVIPNNQLNGVGKQDINIHITAMDSQSVYQAIEPIKRELADMISGTTRTYNLGGA